LSKKFGLKKKFFIFVVVKVAESFSTFEWWTFF